MTGAEPAEPVVEAVEVDAVVVGDDRSAAAEEALRWAARHARAVGRPLTVVQAWSLASALRGAQGPADYVPNLVELQELTRERLRERVARLLGADAVERGVQVHTVHAPAARALVSAAERAELLVVAWRGRGGLLDRLLPGSVAEEVLRSARCSVTLVRPRGQDRALR